ncbi:lysine--tRNA ligase [archaeon]|mgnify:CR=1 FL=1|jgi:lysyl-tRNA synthetase, class I|nr:lysine--tRNA ligase [archaeon]MBT7128820.1 lysine--tRNA ligase [archaeon]
MADKFFWADGIADRIIKEKGDKAEYVCASGITPSGQVHIGNFREVITTDMVVKALEAKGKKVRFIYSWDDFDRFRKVPKGVPEEYEKYLGMPISEIPSPHDDSMSYAEYNEKKFEDSLKSALVNPVFIRQNEMNKKCAYAEFIKVALDSVDDIKEILNKFRKESLVDSWLPIMVYCDKCKKDLTKITKIDDYNVSYECECGFGETFDIRKKGIVKLVWRVDWPARWKYEDVDFEPSGIDHDVYGGSRMTGHKIAKKVFGIDGPIKQTYEWINIKGGEAFSSSSGNALSLAEVGEVYEPVVLRYLFVGIKPKSVFQISFDNDVISIYEKFDALEKKYFDGNCNPKEKRMYEMSIVEIPKERPKRAGFKGLINSVQIGRTEGLNDYDKIRVEKVAAWLEKYAGDDMKFEVRGKIEGKFSDKEKAALVMLKDILREKEFDEKELFDRFYDICEKSGLSNTEFFDACYRAIIGKSKGPRLASLILSVGQDRIVKLIGTLK